MFPDGRSPFSAYLSTCLAFSYMRSSVNPIEKVAPGPMTNSSSFKTKGGLYISGILDKMFNYFASIFLKVRPQLSSQ